MSDEPPKSLLESLPYTPPDPGENPPTFERDLALGRFMNAWSQLEASLRFLLETLSQAPDESAFAIAAAIPDFGKMRELLEALGQLYLEPADQAELLEITNYLLIQNRYRNSIVHGQWAMAPNKEKLAVRGFVYDRKWIRIYTLIDKAKQINAALGVDIKAEEQFVFSVERLQERAQKSLAFANRIDIFAYEIGKRIRKPKPRA